MMPMLSNVVWEIVAFVLAVSILEGAVTGKLRGRRGGYWPVPLRVRPLFGVVGFALVAFILVDVFRRFLKV
jgi:hypothetical protein